MDPLTLALLGTAGGGLIKGLGGMFASDKQAESQERAMALQKEMFGKAQSAWQPFIGAGGDAWAKLAPMLGIGQDSGNPLTGGGSSFGSLTKGFDPSNLANTPGYQWNRDQTLRATQNGFAAKGLGSSGNAILGAGQAASGLAEQTYGNEFGRYWQQNKSIFDELFAPTQQGAQGAASLTNAATQTGAGLANSATGIGNAQAAGINSLAGGVGDALSSGTNMAYQNSLYGPMIAAQTQRLQNQNAGPGYGNNPGDFNPNMAGGINNTPGSSAVTNPLLWMQSASKGGW